MDTDAGCLCRAEAGLRVCTRELVGGGGAGKKEGGTSEKASSGPSLWAAVPFPWHWPAE